MAPTKNIPGRFGFALSNTLVPRLQVLLRYLGLLPNLFFIYLTGLLLSITPLDFFADFTLAGVKTHKLAVQLNALAQRCTSWCPQPRPCVRTLGTKPRGIMCLLVGVVAKVQAPRWVACQWLVLSSSFCGCGSSNLDPPTMGIAVALSSIAAAILLR